MYLASDPWSRDTIILGDAWPWAFHNFANKRYRTAVDLVLTVLIDHCAACAASREEMSHWRGTALPANSFLEAGTNILDEPWKFLDPIPLIWHGESMSRYMMDQDTQDYWDTVIADECQQEINMIGSRSLSEPPPCLPPFTPRPSPSPLMRLPMELRFMIMEELSQPKTSDAYGNSLGTTRTKEGQLSAENLSWVLHWTRLRGVCRQLKLEADAHICRWIQSHDISVHAWDLTGTSDVPVALFAKVTRLTVFFDVLDIDKGDEEQEPEEVNIALWQDYKKALHFLALMPQLKSLTIRWRADSNDAVTDDSIDELQNRLIPDIFQTLYNCSPTDMQCLESITFVGFEDPDHLIYEELCGMVKADEELRALTVHYVGRPTMEFVV